MSDLHTAVHEAGHAVMAARLDRIVGAVHIIPCDGNLGASLDDTDYRFSREEAEHWVLTCVAGYAAVAAANLPGPDSGADDDFEKAQDAIDMWKIGSIDDWKARAVEIMRQPENVCAVKVIADQLIRRRQINGQLFDVLLSWADGDIDDEGLATFEAMASGQISDDGETLVVRLPRR